MSEVITPIDNFAGGPSLELSVKAYSAAIIPLIPPDILEEAIKKVRDRKPVRSAQGEEPMFLLPWQHKILNNPGTQEKKDLIEEIKKGDDEKAKDELVPYENDPEYLRLMREIAELWKTGRVEEGDKLEAEFKAKYQVYVPKSLR